MDVKIMAMLPDRFLLSELCLPPSSFVCRPVELDSPTPRGAL